MLQTSSAVLGLVGVLLLSCSCLAQQDELLERHPRRIISFHAPSPIDANFDPKSLQLHHQQLIPLQPIPSEPAPVHEEQNEPPPPPPRVRAGLDPLMTNPPGFAVDAANFFAAQRVAPQPQRPTGATPGVVQVARPIVPNAPTRIVNPPPAESIPTVNVQPISIDPATGEPLKTVSPTFRALLAPNAPPVNVPAPAQPTFGRGFGGAQILDVIGSSQQQQQLQQQQLQQQQIQQQQIQQQQLQQQQQQPQQLLSAEGFSFPSGFSNQQPQTSSFQSLGNEGGDILSVQTFGATSSINSNSQSFGSTPISAGSEFNSQSFGSLGTAGIQGIESVGAQGSEPTVTTSNDGASHSVHISLPQSSYSSTVFHDKSN